MTYAHTAHVRSFFSLEKLFWGSCNSLISFAKSQMHQQTNKLANQNKKHYADEEQQLFPASISLVRIGRVRRRRHGCCCYSSTNLAYIFSMTRHVFMALLDALFAPLHRCSEKRGTGLGELTRGCASTLWEPDDSSKFLTYKKLFQTSNDWSGAVAWAMIAPRSPLYTARQRLTNLKLGLALKWIVRLKNWVRNGLKLYSVAYA